MTGVTKDILFLSQRVPYPPDRGDRITTWHILRHFLEQGHRVRIGCFLEEDHESASVDTLRELGAEVFSARLRASTAKLMSLPWLLTRRPLTVPYFSNSGLRRSLQESVAKSRPDVCYAYSSSMGFYMFPLAESLANARKVAHFAELDSDKWAQYAETQGFPGRQIYRREAKRLLEWEARLAHASDMSVLCSPVEKQIFEERIPGAPCTVLPNGVDLEAFQPGPDEAKEPNSVVFTGVMNYLPNVDAVQWFADEVWPRVRAKHSDAKFFIVGSKPSPEVSALDGRDGMVVTGRVPTTTEWLQKARVGIAPLRIARGIQNKVLEAMACGLPTVASPKAFTGIDATAGEHALVTETAEETANAVLELFADRARADALGRAARARMEERYEWKQILRAVDEIIG